MIFGYSVNFVFMLLMIVCLIVFLMFVIFIAYFNRTFNIESSLIDLYSIVFFNMLFLGFKNVLYVCDDVLNRYGFVFCVFLRVMLLYIITAFCDDFISSVRFVMYGSFVLSFVCIMYCVWFLLCLYCLYNMMDFFKLLNIVCLYVMKSDVVRVR